MNKVHAFVATTAFPLLLASCSARLKVTHLPAKVSQAGSKLKNGIYYALPLTVVKAEIRIERTYREPAPFRDYALIFFPELLKREIKTGGNVEWKVDVADKRETTYSIKDPVLSTFGEPDPNHVYFVEIQDNKRLDQAITLTWTDRGAVTGAKATVDDTTGDMIMSAVSMAAGLASRTAFGAITPSSKKTSPCPVEPHMDDVKVFDALTIDGTRDEGLAGNYCGLPPSLRQQISAKLDADGIAKLKSAKAVYDEQLKPLVDARGSLIRGINPTTDLSGALRELNALINGLRDKYFRGIEDKSSWSGIFEARADFEERAGSVKVENQSLLRIHKNNGVQVVGVLAPGNKPMPPEWLLAGAGDEVKLDLSQFETDRKAQLAGIVAAYPGNDAGERSFFYRIPATSVTRLKQGQETLVESQQTIGQLGVIRSLPANASSRSLGYDVTFIETTGALRSLGLTTKALMQKGYIDSASTSANALLDARQKANDEVTRLEREFKILDFQSKICTLRAAAGQPCPTPPPSPTAP
jgi:hypothetical protein